MKYFKEFLNAYAPSMIHAAFVTIFSYIAIIIKNTYQNYMKDIQKKKVVETVKSLSSDPIFMSELEKQ